MPLFYPPIDFSFIASRFERVEKHEPLWLSVSIFDSHLERVYSSKHLPQAKAFEPDSTSERLFSPKKLPSDHSCHAMPHAGGSVKIITRKDGNCVSMTIADNGHGISDAIIQRVFEPFFTTKGENGNGFGLSQVYGFVKQANGTVSIESNKTGTAVRIDLPSEPKSSSGASERLTMAAGRGLQERREYR